MNVQEQVKQLIERAQGLLAEAEKQIKSGKAENARFRKLPDGWVLDKMTGREWGPSSEKTMNFEAANKYCEELGGRLPTRMELISLIDETKYDPSIDTQFFKDTKSSWYWTGTDYAGNSSCAWCVGFDNGGVFNGNEDGDSYVRPVRASQCLIF
jgi:hypothetical protein